MLISCHNTRVESPFSNQLFSPSFSFQIMLSDDNAIIAARQPPRRSLVAFARRENAKLKAYASLT